MRMFDDHREPQQFQGPRHVVGRAGDNISRKIDTREVTGHLHRHARRIIERRARTGERHVQLLQRLHHLATGTVLVPGAVA